MTEPVRYMTTMVVESDGDVDADAVTIEIPQASGEPVQLQVSRADFEANFHRLDRQVFDFALALALMRCGAAVRRRGWLKMVRSITISEGCTRIVECGEPGYDSDMPTHQLRTTDILATDWVVDQ